jgi:hypothetical protein
MLQCRYREFCHPQIGQLNTARGNKNTGKLMRRVQCTVYRALYSLDLRFFFSSRMEAANILEQENKDGLIS